MAPNTTFMSLSTSSLHHLIVACPFKLKPTNYLIWRTQIMQLMQVMKVTNLIKGERQSSTTYGKEKMSEGKEKEDLETLWEEKDVWLRTWISGNMIEESMYLTVGCSIEQEMWECLEEIYLQATINKEFQLKQQL
ncbi:hypothetical protein KY290_030901 [Solanum tuberosum]|uniref:Retrotransposon Copia-like N-terminal domain-containing protein n=1 Tax=Solanum tuberosum TaxID=4113 RepID=A0ABQ7U9G2_SOLTU|nr:hypothetical protein KY285_029981 [Solanum tuberosum]KAH0742908.1 hypothetical protein KY290_030901 [Solanum tuberosum]